MPAIAVMPPSGQVDQEDPAPARGDEQAADRGTHGGGKGRARRPQPDGRRAALGGNSGSSRASEVGIMSAAPTAWITRAPTRVQGPSEGAERRGDQEEAETAEEDPLAPDQVGQPPGRHEQGREDDRVAVQHPGELGEARAGEVRLDRRKGDVDDEEVEVGEKGPGGDDQQYLPAAGHRPTSI